MASQARRTHANEGNGEEGGSAATSNANAANMPGVPSMANLAEVARQQMLFASQALGVLFRSSEAIYRANMQAGERAALLHGQASENIRKAGTAADLMSVQVTLAVYQTQEATRYWQEIGAAMMSMGTEMMRSAPAVGGAATADEGRTAGGPAVQQATTAATAMMDAAMSAAAPMADALQQMFTAPLRPANGAPRQH